MENVKSLQCYREQMGLSQSQLGERVGVTRQTIAAWEQGKRRPSVAHWIRIARELGIGIDLLLDEGPPATGEWLFRADEPTALSDALRGILAQKAIAYAEIERIADELPTLPEMRPLEGYDAERIEEVALETRHWLGVGGALGDVLALLEAKGLKVIAYPLPNSISGCSAFTEKDGATIFVNAGHPLERQFFTALHELAHLVFHRQEYSRPSFQSKGRAQKEKAANHFAGAILLSADAIRRELRPYRDRWLPEPLLADIKRRYAVSMRTVLCRAAQVGLISDKQKGRQIGQLNKKYGRDFEPDNLCAGHRLTRLERLVYCTLVREKITISRAAEVLGKPLAEVRCTLKQWLPQDAA